MGAGHVFAAGRIESGVAVPGAKILVIPQKKEAIVRSVDIAGTPVSHARSGTSVDLLLGGIEASDIG